MSDSPPFAITQSDWTDNSITSEDQDRFDYQDYAEILTDRILAAGTPLVVGIYGRWGSGKTSLMNLIRVNLHNQFRDKDSEKSQKIETICLDVWTLSSRDQMWNAFLQALITTAHQKLSWLNRLKFDLTLLKDRVRWRQLLRTILLNLYRVAIVIAPLLLPYLAPTTEAGEPAFGVLLSPVLGRLASLILGLWLVVRPVMEEVRSRLSLDLDEILEKAPFEQQITTLDQLKNQFERIVRLWVGPEGRLIVFIDDLDRCTPDQIPEVLEAVKLFATTPGCIYVMALDNDIVQKGIKNHYQFEKESDGAEYMEKIIQIPFHLPPLDPERVQEFLGNHYPSLNQISASAAEVFSKGLEPIPRKVKRALNIYYTLIELANRRADAWVMDPVHPGLVAKMVVIQSRFPAVYKRLVIEPEFLYELQAASLAKAGISDEYYYRGEEFIVDRPEEIDKVLSEIKELVPLHDQPALDLMLQVGKTAFPPQAEEIATYIYLTSAVEGSISRLRPTRKEREALLGNNEAKIKDQVAEIKNRSQESMNPRGIIREYNHRLWSVLKFPKRFTGEEVKSAMTALAHLRQEFEPQMSLIGEIVKESDGKDHPPSTTVIFPPSTYTIGSTEDQVISADRGSDVFARSEVPQVKIKLSPYFIGKFPVTQSAYKAFTDDTGWDVPDHWDGRQMPSELGNYPVYNVNWYDAVEYCKWLSLVTGKPYRLPTEEEWEAAAGEHVFPWGDDWNPDRGNTLEGGVGTTTPVGKYSSEGDSPYSIADMAGNVLEWCGDPEWHTAKGGSFAHNAWWARRAARAGYDPEYRGECMGFRVALSPASQ